MTVDDLDTPTLVIDLDKMEHNLQKLGDYCKRHNLQLRPHTKTHKTPEIAHMQIESAATGITVAKIGEAEIMADAGLRDIMIAYPIVSKKKLGRLTALAKRVKITVSMDSLEVAQGISHKAQEDGVEINLLIEVDAGLHRCGLTGVENVVTLAKAIKAMPAVTFQGLMCYPGHVAKYKDQDQEISRINNLLLEYKNALNAENLPVQVFSGGSTPMAYRSHEFTQLTEIRPGTYVFTDLNTAECPGWSLENCAASLLVTVVSTAVPGQIIIDGGSKTFSSDGGAYKELRGFGYCVEDPGLALLHMNEEHGIVSLEKAQDAHKIGDRLHFIPNHICTAVNMHEKLYGVRTGNVEKVWQVAGRGKLQ